MYYLDSLLGKDGREVYGTKGGFRYPLSKDHNSQYKIKGVLYLRQRKYNLLYKAMAKVTICYFTENY